MCTVVVDTAPGAAVRILALRDELTTRPFDDPDAWWPANPGVVGGRDRTAGGTWCATDVAAGVTALVLNRPERRTGTPSRGGLPLAALSAGAAWPDTLEVSGMASFTLLLAGPSGVQSWEWDGTALTHRVLEPGRHMVTSRGIETDGPRTVRYGPLLTPDSWQDVVQSCSPSAAGDALVVRHETPHGVYATVFGQLITSSPGRLDLTWSRTPWRAGTWTSRTWT